MSLLKLEFAQSAVFLPRLGLWLDAHHAVKGPERVMVSHAHADHTARHREVILTDPTARLMQARLGGQRMEHRLAFEQPRDFTGTDAPFRLTLLPAGHILGSAMALVEAGGESLLYTGDFKLRPGAAAEHCHPHPADVLVMETTFGLPEYVFPDEPQVVADLVSFCRETLASGRNALLLAWSLGKTQELLLHLARTGLPLAVTPASEPLNRIYREAGVPLPPCDVLPATTAHPRVVICPPNAAAAADLPPDQTRRAVVTGWALDPGCRYRYGVDAAFPLSDHADFPDLLRFVTAVAPRQVLTLHGFAAGFARTLRELGHNARALGQVEQLDLALGVPPRPRSRRRQTGTPAVAAMATPAPPEGPDGARLVNGPVLP